jgi:hypothetical protein
MRHTFLTNTFSPAMLATGGGATVQEITLAQAREELSSSWESAVSHEVTAGVLSALLGLPVQFARVNLVLNPADRVVCIIPNFRASEAREFTREEVEGAGYRCFLAVAC